MNAAYLHSCNLFTGESLVEIAECLGPSLRLVFKDITNHFIFIIITCKIHLLICTTTWTEISMMNVFLFTFQQSLSCLMRNSEMGLGNRAYDLTFLYAYAFYIIVICAQLCLIKVPYNYKSRVNFLGQVSQGIPCGVRLDSLRSAGPGYPGKPGCLVTQALLLLVCSMQKPGQ